MNLSRDDTIQKNGSLIKDWASTVSKLTSKPSSTTGSIRTLGSIAHSTAMQVTSQHSTASTKKAIILPVLPDDDVESNGLSDHNETIGNE